MGQGSGPAAWRSFCAGRAEQISAGAEAGADGDGRRRLRCAHDPSGACHTEHAGRQLGVVFGTKRAIIRIARPASGTVNGVAGFPARVEAWQ